MEAKTTLVNVKVAHIRPQYDNLKEWCEDENNVYIARKGVVFVPDEKSGKVRYPPSDSTWANPFKLPKGKDTDADRAVVSNQYEEYTRERLANEPRLVDELLALRGKNLGCWCTPKTCHGEVLLILLEEYST